MKQLIRHKNRLEKRIMKCVAKEIKPHWGKLWGQKSWNTPAYCGVVNGNGRQVVWLQTLSSRPDYYVLRIDSKHDVKSDDFDTEILLNGAEESYGNVDSYKQEYINGELMVREYYADDDEPWLPYDSIGFPMLDCSCGYSWGTVKTF